MTPLKILEINELNKTIKRILIFSLKGFWGFGVLGLGPISGEL